MKIAPIHTAFQGIPGVLHILVHSGQHYDQDFIRLRRTTKHENRVQRAASRRRVSLWYKQPW